MAQTGDSCLVRTTISPASKECVSAIHVALYSERMFSEVFETLMVLDSGGG